MIGKAAKLQKSESRFEISLLHIGSFGKTHRGTFQHKYHSKKPSCFPSKYSNFSAPKEVTRSEVFLTRMADENEITEEIEALRAIYPDLDITDLSENGGQGTSREHR